MLHRVARGPGDELRCWRSWPRSSPRSQFHAQRRATSSSSATCRCAVLVPFLFAEVNLFLGVFNFLPIPPLDGAALIERVLPQRVAAGLVPVPAVRDPRAVPARVRARTSSVACSSRSSITSYRFVFAMTPSRGAISCGASSASLRPRPLDAADLAFVRGTLQPAELACWERLGPADRAESVATGARRARGALGADADPRWVAAALLHDVGKAETGLGPFGRSVATVVAAGRRARAGPGRWTGRGRALRQPRRAGCAAAAGGRRPAGGGRVGRAPTTGPTLWPATGIPPAICEILAAADGEPRPASELGRRTRRYSGRAAADRVATSCDSTSTRPRRGSDGRAATGRAAGSARRRPAGASAARRRRTQRPGGARRAARRRARHVGRTGRRSGRAASRAP